MSQQIYAVLKRTSKYVHQAEPGAMFPVTITVAGRDEYRVHGNHNDYRLADVQLWLVDGDNKLRIA